MKLNTFVKVVICILFIAAVGGFTAGLVMNWMIGCGETYIDALGLRHKYDCLHVPLFAF